MKHTKLLLALLAIFITLQTNAQRRSTSVKGYYRKNGTYVSPHTRHYDAGNGSSTSTSYYSGSTNTQNTSGDGTPNNTTLSILTVSPVGKSEYSKTTASKYSYGKADKIVPTTLETAETGTDLPGSDTVNTAPDKNTKGIVIYVSVLRYNGRAIDICPITRGVLGDWEFDKVTYTFNKAEISTEDALDLVSNYGWHIKEDKISKYHFTSYSNKESPEYLSTTIEAIKLK